MSDNFKLHPPKSHKISTPRRLALRGKGKTSQLLELQADLYFAQLDAPPKMKASLASAWERLENRLARMRMKPEPRPVAVPLRPRGRKPSSSDGVESV